MNSPERIKSIARQIVLSDLQKIAEVPVKPVKQVLKKSGPKLWKVILGVLGAQAALGASYGIGHHAGRDDISGLLQEIIGKNNG